MPLRSRSVAGLAAGPSAAQDRHGPAVIGDADFFSVEVLTLTGLVRYFVLFVIDLQTWHVQIGGVVQQPFGGAFGVIHFGRRCGSKRVVAARRDHDPLAAG